MLAPSRTILARAVVLVLAGTGVVGCGGPADEAPPAGEAAGSVAAPEPASFASVVAAVEDRVAIYDGIATGVIALVRVGDETKVLTGGSADVATGRPPEPGMTFPIASITKPMTAALVLQLVEEGRLDLSDDLRKELPALAAVDSPITLEQVLSHRSGLREVGGADVDRVGFGTADLVAASATHHLDFAPGTDGVYSNVGFAALGLLVERVLDQPFGEALSERVLVPAGMGSSSLGGTPDVQGYVDGKPVRNYYLDFLPPAGSVVATARDVDAFFRSLWAGELVPDDLVAEMRESRGQVRIGSDWRPDYGLGLIRWSVSCGTAIGHSGRIEGFTNEAWTLEDQDRSAVVSVNDQDADQIARSIVQTALCGEA